jgi:hypothetical protein
MPSSPWGDPVDPIPRGGPDQPVVTGHRAGRRQRWWVTGGRPIDSVADLGENRPVNPVRWRWQPSPEDDALFSQRARHHLVYRLAGRACQIAVARNRGASNRTIAGVLVWAASDVVGAVALTRTNRFGLLPRLGVDVVDVTTWGSTGDDCELAVISGVPLAVEAGGRLGPAALVIPLVTATATSLVRRRRGLPLSLFSFRWQVVGVGVGLGLAVYRRTSHRVQLARHDRELRARRQQAYVGGQNDVAMGADSVVDLLSRTAPLLPSGSGDQVAGRLLASWKQSLAADTMAQTTYLGVTLARWQRRHNATHHALNADVLFAPAEGAGTVLLSGDQAGWLDDALDALELRGRVPVLVVDPAEAAQPNTARRIRVGTELLVVPADRRKGLQPVDIGPAGFAAGAMWCFDTLTSNNSKSSVYAIGPMVGGAFGLAAWSNWQVDRHGPRAHGRIVAAGMGWALAHAVAGTATMSRTRAGNGMQRYPFLSGLDTMGLILPLYFSDFTRPQQAAVVAGLALVIGVGLLLMPEPVVWTHLGCELLWSVAPTLSIVGLGDGLSASAERLNAQLAEEEDIAISRAFAEGRDFVISMVNEASLTVQRAFEVSKEHVRPDVAAEIELRLAELGRRLNRLGGSAGLATDQRLEPTALP